MKGAREPGSPSRLTIPDRVAFGHELIYGNHAIMAALETRRRRIHRIFLLAPEVSTSHRKLISLAEREQIPVVFEQKLFFDSMAPGASHQGGLAEVDPLPLWSPAELAASMTSERQIMLLLLDSIQDPHNLGAILRTAEAFGTFAVIVPYHRSAPLGGAAAKAAAGSLDRVRVCQAVNLRNFVLDLKKRGFWFGALVPQSGVSPLVFDPPPRFGLVVGSEAEGIRPLLVRECDFALSIPMSGSVESLNVSVAVGVALSGLKRNRVELENLKKQKGMDD